MCRSDRGNQVKVLLALVGIFPRLSQRCPCRTLQVIGTATVIDGDTIIVDRTNPSTLRAWMLRKSARRQASPPSAG